MEEGDISETPISENPSLGRTNQEQIHDILFSREISWQEIIYDLINSEQLDPWDIDIGVLTNKYMERISKLEEQDFFVSSKVLLAAAFLLRIKSELLLSKYLKSIDEILFGKKEDEKLIRQIDWSQVDIDDIPDLVPKSPLPRFKRVTLQELISSLDKAIITENRRIKKEIVNSNALRETSISLPKRKYNPQTKSKEIYGKLFDYIESNSVNKIAFTDLAGIEKEERIISFTTLMVLESQRKVWLEQRGHFEEFYIWPHELYMKTNPNIFADLIEEYEAELKKELEEEEKRKKKLEKKESKEKSGKRKPDRFSNQEEQTDTSEKSEENTENLEE
jgi:chromatin segregation and condensation protein Rec8/ScpA/Scc1 (kleisin family)